MAMRVIPSHRAAASTLLMLCALCAAPAGGCVEQVVIHTATNPAASFARYRSFSFGSAEAPPRGYTASAWSPEVRGRVQPLITAALAARGYSATPESGDLVIRFGSGRRTVAIRESGDTGGDTWLPNDENGSIVERSLVVDAFDARTGVRVWHGSSSTEIDPDHVSQALLERTVSGLIAAFPLRSSGASEGRTALGFHGTARDLL